MEDRWDHGPTNRSRSSSIFNKVKEDVAPVWGAHRNSKVGLTRTRDKPLSSSELKLGEFASRIKSSSRRGCMCFKEDTTTDTGVRELNRTRFTGFPRH